MSALATASPAAIDLRTIAPRERHALVFARFDALQAGQTLQPVSYTHLDVYKRQVDDQLGYSCANPTGAASTCAMKTTDSPWSKRAFRKSRAAGRSPVSYTHLDVYKRQELPMEFALEAKALLAVSLEGAVG